MNDTNPQNDGDYTPSEPNPYTSDGVSGTSDNATASSSSDARQHQTDSSFTDNFRYPTEQASLPSTSESNRLEGASQNPVESSIPPLSDSTSQSQNSQYETSQYSNSQPASQYNPEQPTSQYNAAAQTPQYANSKRAPQYTNPQQAQNNVPPQFTASQPVGGQGGAPVFPGNMAGQPYGNPNPDPNNFAASMAVPLDMPYYGCPPIEAVKRFFLKYVKFSGRASRSEYWWVQLFLLIAYFLIFFLDGLLFRKSAGFVNLIFELALFIPSISIAVRRLHDSNKSGWWWLLPYGLYIAGITVVAISLVVTLGGIAIANPSQSLFGAVGAGMMIALIVSFLCLLAGFVLKIVLMVLGPNPQGARFDEVSAPVTFTGGQYPPMMNQGNPAGNQYGGYAQPIPQQNPFNQTYPQTPTQPASTNNPYTRTGNPQYQPQATVQPEGQNQSQNPFGQQGQQEAQAPQTPLPDNGFNAGNNNENNGNSSLQ